jgi:membrane-associated phospholipid phosphatase
LRLPKTTEADDAFLGRAVRAGLALPVLFALVYGGCAWLTSRRADVSSFTFACEKHLPVVRWMLIPYLSLDGLFLAAVFLCRDAAELRVLVRRVVMAILVAGAGFLVWPMRVESPRLTTSGPWEWAYRVMWRIDPSYNAFPSLHVAIAVVLWISFASRVGRGLQVIVHAIFTLVVLSTLLTHQHQMIDVAGGAALGIACARVFRA